ncbi:uncharacterized protein LOC144756185 [Lissotriton helveticus]
MNTQEKDKSEAAGRKRKQTFCEKELEVLIEEMVKGHELLFSKKSLHIPQSEKHKIWLDIQTKVNAIGVTQRSIGDLRKRWYNMRSRDKDKVANRLANAKKTGGGPSSKPASTLLEDLVESTLQPESSSGVADIDSSARPNTRQGEPATRGDHTEPDEVPQLQDEAGGEETDQTTQPIPAQKQRCYTVPPFSELEGELEGKQDEPKPEQEEQARQEQKQPPMHRRDGSCRKCRPRAQNTTDVGDDSSVFSGLEGTMVKHQRLQAKSMRSMNRQFVTVNHNQTDIKEGIRELNHTVEEGNKVCAGSIKEITGAIKELCATMQRNHASRRIQTSFQQSGSLQQSSQLFVQCNNCTIKTHGVYADGNGTLQQDIAKGLMQVTNAVDQLQTANIAGTSLLVAGDSEVVSSRSSIIPPLTEPRQRSVRQGTASDDSSREGTQNTERVTAV